MLDELYSKDVITLEEKEMIGTFRLRSEKMVHFLDYIIIPSLHNNCTLKFKRFLEMMEESDDVLLNAMAEYLGMFKCLFSWVDGVYLYMYNTFTPQIKVNI